MRHYENLLRATLTALLTLGGVVGAAVADPLEDGAAAYERGDYATAARLFRPLAEQGDARAQELFGEMYYFGRGVPQDLAEALKWTRKAAEQGRVEAQDNLGFMYEKGRGVQQDFAEALKWFRIAGDQGDARALFSLGRMYELGEGVPKSDADAVNWYRNAADQGDANGQLNLGVMYANGRGGYARLRAGIQVVRSRRRTLSRRTTNKRARHCRPQPQRRRGENDRRADR